MASQLWLGDTTLPALIERVAEAGCAEAPDLGLSRTREIVDLIFRTHVQQSASCARHGVCSDVGAAVWGGRGRLPITEGTARPCQLTGVDPHDLPSLLAVALASADMPLAGARRDALEQRLATIVRQALLPYLFENEHCGHAPVCRATRADPFEPIP